MLSLTPPYHLIGGFTLLSDHADPRLWYVMPNTPTLAVTPNGRPAFSLVQYLGGGTGEQKVAGGLLSLTTELRVPDHVMPELRAELSRITGQPREALSITPLMFDTGSVELIALGASSAPPARGEDNTPPGPAAALGVRFLGSGKASLGGANTATFQLMLDERAAELVEKTLDAPDLPIITTYRLTFVGLRPSFNVEVHADWTNVYRTLQQRVQANAYYATVDAEQHVSRALEDSSVRIDVTVLGPDDTERAAAERARQQLVEWVLQRLFTPAVSQEAATANLVTNAISGMVTSLVRSVVPGASYTLRVMDDQQLRTLSARMNEAVAERREILPQGTLGGLMQHLRVDPQGRERPDWAARRDDLVTRVSLDGFPRLDVSVGTADRFRTDGVSEVRVELATPGHDGAPGEPRRTFAFRSAADQHAYVVNLLGRADVNFARLYQYRVEVDFDPGSPVGARPTVRTGWREGRAAELIVEPRWAYGVHDVHVHAAPSFPFAQFPDVTAEFRYAEPGLPEQRGRVALSATTQSGTWRYWSLSALPGPYTVTLTYHRPNAAGGNVTAPPLDSTDDWLTVPDPLPFKRSVNVFVSLPWQDLLVAYVQFRYDDPASGVKFEEQVDLTPAAPYFRRDYPIAQGGPRTLAYRLTVLSSTGSLLEGSWRETMDDRIVIDRRLVERRAIRVQTIGGTLADLRLREVRVELERRDATGHAMDRTELKFTRDAAAPLAPWEVLIGDPPDPTVHYSAVFIDDAGFVTRTPWSSTRSDLLVVQLRTKTITA